MQLVVQTAAVRLALQLVLIGVFRWLLALIGAARDPIGLMTIAAATDHLDQPRSIHWSFRSVDFSERGLSERSCCRSHGWRLGVLVNTLIGDGGHIELQRASQQHQPGQAANGFTPGILGCLSSLYAVVRLNQYP